ncbi:response regulator transcription factor [Sphingomonas sp. MMS24-J13]|uniref:response regulator transcription factor n=1 Tax=Sphingomonas sp. MMS24-J13 TaxID=3238686 RepID=UPI00384C7305
MRNIYIVDDDDAVRASLQSLLATRPNLLVRTFRSGDAFLAEVKELDRGVLLLDVHMPGSSGIDVLRALPDSRQFASIVLTGQGNITLAVDAMKAGALDFVEKPYEHLALLQMVEGAFSRLETDSADAARVESARAKLARLSGRETDVLKGLIDGQANKVIAHHLDISPRTVEIYRAHLMEKLEVRSLSEALRVAFAAGLYPSG